MWIPWWEKVSLLHLVRTTDKTFDPIKNINSSDDSPEAARVLTSLAVLCTCTVEGGWNQCKDFMASKKSAVEIWPSSLVSSDDRPPWEMTIMTSTSCINSFYYMHLLSNDFSILANTSTNIPLELGSGDF